MSMNTSRKQYLMNKKNTLQDRRSIVKSIPRLKGRSVILRTPLEKATHSSLIPNHRSRLNFPIPN